MALEADLLPGQFLTKVGDMAKRQKGLPPVDAWNPDFCGDIDMVVRRDGSWHYMGTPINRPEMVRLFSTILRRDGDGRYYLVTPGEKVGIEVEDAPFLAVAMERSGMDRSQTLRFVTNLGDEAVAGRDHPLRFEIDPETEEVSPYVHIRGRLEAKLSRPVYYELVDLADIYEFDGTEQFGVWSGGMFFPIAERSMVGL